MSKWYKASELERLNTPMPMDGVNGLPDNHVITVSERTIEIDESELVQNNVSTDTFTLELDAEWDDITPVVIFSNSKGDYKVAYENGPTKIPAAAMAAIGSVDVSVFGLDSTGEVRVVTKAAPNTMNVVESGKFVGQVSSDDVSLLGQILQAVSDANAAAETANTAAENAGTTVNQLKESVETFLSQSQTSVNNAVSSAGKATSAANTAAQTANTAANNADKSADTADAAATKANTSASRAENAYTTLQPILADISVSGNQPRKTLSGNIVSANDAWPAKPLGIRVKGKTRQNLWVNPSGTMNGITVTANDDGSVTLSGTNTGYVQISSPIIYTVRPNTTYTLSVDKVVSSSSSSSISFVLFGTNGITGVQNIHVGYTDKLSQTFTTNADVSNVGCRFYISASMNTGNTVSGTYRIMLNEGDTAEPWCPPGLNSVDELSLVTAGKNVLVASQDIEDLAPWQSSIIEDAGDGWISVSSSIILGVQLNSATQRFLVGETYTLSFEAYLDSGKSDISYNYLMGVLDDQNAWNLSISSIATNSSCTASTSPKMLHVTFTIPDTVVKNGHLLIGSNQCSKFYVRNIQLELGSTATDYEPSQVTTTPIDLDGNSLCSLPDGTRDELTIDATGAVTLTKRVGAVDYKASEFNPANPNYNEAVLSKPYAGGIDFSRSKQFSDFATIGNVHSAPGHPEISACTTNASSTLRGGTGSAESSSIEQNTKFKSMLGSATWHHLYALAAPETISLDPIILPLLPSPNITVYADAPITPDMELEYVRDVNKAIQKLEAQIADLVTKEAANV